MENPRLKRTCHRRYFSNTYKKLSLIGLYLFSSVLLAASTGSAEISRYTDEAETMFAKCRNFVYQVRVIDTATGEKASIGSAFLFAKNGYIATNYHVIASAVRFPKRYHIEYLKADNSIGLLKIIDADIIHDIAIVKTDDPLQGNLELGESLSLSQGTKVFSLGNPHDLGTTIVEGLYNGLMKDSLYKKILFSGSINPGMSGGPSLSHDGKVIGINVSTMGNQLSFLVPVEFLKDLFERLQKRGLQAITDWDTHIETQLLKNQGDIIDTMLTLPWESSSIGEAIVPSEITKAYKCWADSEDYKDELYKKSWLQCYCQDSVYIDSDFYTGMITYDYTWLESKNLNTVRFYNVYEYFFIGTPFGNASKHDVDKFSCTSDFVSIDKTDWKIALCARNYKRFPQLYDFHAKIASVSKKNKGLVIHLSLLGTTKDKALSFIKKFIDEIRWQK